MHRKRLSKQVTVFRRIFMMAMIFLSAVLVFVSLHADEPLRLMPPTEGPAKPDSRPLDPEIRDLSGQKPKNGPKAADQAVTVLSVPLSSAVQEGDVTGNLPEQDTAGLHAARRFRRVELDHEVFLPGVVQKGDTLKLNLFRDRTIWARVDKTSTDINGVYGIRARVEGSSHGYAVFSASHEGVLGTISVPENNEEYRLSHIEDLSSHVIQEIDPELKDVLEDRPLMLPSGEQIADQMSPSLQDMSEVTAGKTKIDIMVLYTPAANSWADQQATSMGNVINQALQTANIVFDHSSVGIDLDLVHSRGVSYLESGDSGTDLERLTFHDDFDPRNTEGSSRYLEQVHEWRKTYQADLVNLMTKVNDVGGMAWVLNRPDGVPQSGFSLTRVQQAAFSMTMVHELGHNMGAGHHKQQEHQPGPGLFDDSAGWRWTGLDGRMYCSVMTYASGEHFSDGQDSKRLPVFSNPMLAYEGVRTGHAEDGNNAGTLMVVKQAVADYCSQECRFSIQPQSHEFDNRGGEQRVNISSAGQECRWVVLDDVPWASVTPLEGRGNGQLTVTIEPNTGASRHGQVTIGGRTFRISQEASQDPDGDGLTSDVERRLGSDPFDADTDEDGLVDGQEDSNANGLVDDSETDPCSLDTDGDGLQDGTELGITLESVGQGTDLNIFQPDLDPDSQTDPLNPDSDGDGFSDGQEDYNLNGRLDNGETNPLPSRQASKLYYPHVASNRNWRTEIAVINTSSEDNLNGVLKAYDAEGGQVSADIQLTLPPRGREQLQIGRSFEDPDAIRYIVLSSNSAHVCGYTKFSRNGMYRAAVPAVTEVNRKAIAIPHVDSSQRWWTGLALVNTTSQERDVTITFGDGQSRIVSMAPGEHRSFTVRSLFADQPRPDIHSGLITNACGIIGLELFGNDNLLGGVLLKDECSRSLTFPHVDRSGPWWTGVVGYNPGSTGTPVKMTTFEQLGNALNTKDLNIDSQRQHVGTAGSLGIPDTAAWFQLDSVNPISGMELLGTRTSLAGYSGVNIQTPSGVFPKIEKEGWTGIALVNCSSEPNTVSLKVLDDFGNEFGALSLPLFGHEKHVGTVKGMFSPHVLHDGTYIAFDAHADVVGIQLNGSADGTFMDALPCMKLNSLE